MPDTSPTAHSHRGGRPPVLVVPGYLTSDSVTAAMRATLSSLGYSVYGWGQGVNNGDPAQQAGLGHRMVALHERTGQKVSLVGFSLGGAVARAVARVHPEAARLVVTVSSPFRRREGDDAPVLPVPGTCMFSKDDSVARWNECIQPDDDTHENVEFTGPHLSITHHPAVLAVLVDRLAQPAGQWRPFRPGLSSWMFPRSRADARR